jgi:hypothetical protein
MSHQSWIDIYILRIGWKIVKQQPDKAEPKTDARVRAEAKDSLTLRKMKNTKLNTSPTINHRNSYSAG